MFVTRIGYLFVTRKYSYVTRMLRVCPRIHVLVCVRVRLLLVTSSFMLPICMPRLLACTIYFEVKRRLGRKYAAFMIFHSRSCARTKRKPLHGKKRTGLNRPVDIMLEHACAGQREQA